MPTSLRTEQPGSCPVPKISCRLGKHAALLTFLTLSRLASAQSLGSINGTVKTQSGSAVPNATVVYGRMAPARGAHAAPSILSPVLSVTTSAAGAFSITNLAAATYLLCVQAPAAVVLDPCHWSASPPTFTVAVGQAISNATLPVTLGYRLLVQINDP